MLLTLEFMKKYLKNDDSGNLCAKDSLTVEEIEEILFIDDWHVLEHGEHFIQNYEELKKRLPYEYKSSLV